MKHASRRSVLAVACFATLAGCEAGKQREQILQNQQQLSEDLRTARQELLDKQKTSLKNQDASAAREQEMLKVANTGVSNQKQILSLVKDTNSVSHGLTTTLDKVFTEVYGVGVDMRAALGETRIVIEVNNDMPLRVHSEIPSSTMESEVVQKLPTGAVIFRSQKVSDRWWKGMVLKDGEPIPVYFAAQYTKPLRDELTPEGGMSVGGMDR